jgi:hypothetical protein
MESQDKGIEGSLPSGFDILERANHEPELPTVSSTSMYHAAVLSLARWALRTEPSIRPCIDIPATANQITFFFAADKRLKDAPPGA